jgi:hypothetical protein
MEAKLEKRQYCSVLRQSELALQERGFKSAKYWEADEPGSQLAIV